MSSAVGRLRTPTFVASILMAALVAALAADNRDLRLVEAARNGDWQAVRALLKQHADVESGSTARPPSPQSYRICQRGS
jgi:hypothetical protein